MAVSIVASNVVVSTAAAAAGVYVVVVFRFVWRSLTDITVVPIYILGGGARPKYRMCGVRRHAFCGRMLLLEPTYLEIRS